MSPKSLRVLHSRCTHYQNCSIQASTNMFDDPCPGTHKYLEAHYQCLPGINCHYNHHNESAKSTMVDNITAANVEYHEAAFNQIATLDFNHSTIVYASPNNLNI
ncbi:hypothetical protein NQ315_002625 [Exocentrus adspersus]|uniref:SUEL-type lectin domain-containing protein n=1 Tax=Exocentrus adspersus TaxID=1586481 RepID=A0AAV8VVJ4_9CUCU|nr:hypothetical protein NQ315_002625 [Exocentrus adspersus]